MTATRDLDDDFTKEVSVDKGRGQNLTCSSVTKLTIPVVSPSVKLSWFRECHNMGATPITDAWNVWKGRNKS